MVQWTGWRYEESSHVARSVRSVQFNLKAISHKITILWSVRYIRFSFTSYVRRDVSVLFYVRFFPPHLLSSHDCNFPSVEPQFMSFPDTFSMTSNSLLVFWPVSLIPTSYWCCSCNIPYGTRIPLENQLCFCLHAAVFSHIFPLIFKHLSISIPEFQIQPFLGFTHTCVCDDDDAYVGLD